MFCCRHGEKWQSSNLETWLTHVQTMRKQSHKQSLTWRFDNDKEEIDEHFRKRAKMLSTSASLQFKEWRLKTHFETLQGHLHSMEELQRDLEKHGWQIIE